MPEWNDVDKIVKAEASDVADGLRAARDRLDAELAKKERELAATPQERMDMLLADIEAQNAATDALLAEVDQRATGQTGLEAPDQDPSPDAGLDASRADADQDSARGTAPDGAESTAPDGAESTAPDGAESTEPDGAGGTAPTAKTPPDETLDTTEPAPESAQPDPAAKSGSPRPATRPVSELQIEYEQRKAKADDLLDELRDELGIDEP